MHLMLTSFLGGRHLLSSYVCVTGILACAQHGPAGRRLRGRGVAATVRFRPRRNMPLAGPVPAQYGEGWLKITARLVILPSRMPK